ncbi:pyridoxal-dependent decarboxylase, exosortase A system-associated [Sandaracinobacteroides saxicola]|uniref:Pyridoxal-dependent decarboxylase, exosortase A system-associated n=1 Tax=Sandaracinobacteroides saxicola TaxID=2759707 RepID=A0A7G5IKP9_9SPHN|nr:pyridoxal-dependent decarboxylase, exosortase A system-associated [Sandaracinobacteroides saxicola]QMW23941.1 pyridoxal-dependent decarboxylase, exosortase A system-associated [Sandaracinobacteroides saxicola]
MSGHVPPGFGVRDGALVIAGRTAEQWVAEAGDTPLFVYDRVRVAAKVSAFRAAFPGVRLHYAMKANPFAPLLAWMAGLVDGVDVASGGELAAAVAAGAREISFAGPAKRDAELAAAIEAGATINLESVGEMRRAAALAAGKGLRARVAVRVNPPFELKGSGMRMGGGAKPFGVDADAVPDMLRAMAGLPLDFRGFHIFAGSQNLDAGAIIAAQRETVALAAALAAQAPCPPALVNLGGGFGVPYFPGDVALDVGLVGAALAEALSARPAVLAETEFALELGRWLVADAGVYLTRVVDRKMSGGQLFLACDGGLHHQLAASGNFGTVIRRNYPLANATRFAAEPEEVANVVGCLCTPLDRLGDRVMLPRTEEGDLIALFMAGAYGRTASPGAFLGHPPPGEIFA